MYKGAQGCGKIRTGRRRKLLADAIPVWHNKGKRVQRQLFFA